jgi:V8-like Glu-specific endopeptidase
MKFEGQPSDQAVYLGTGWLVDANTIATAGHCVYDENFGRLQSVNVIFGIESGDSTTRTGTHAVVHWCWYTSFAKKSDLGFIRLNKKVKVTETRPLSYINTPTKAPYNSELIVRGYPDHPDHEDRMQFSKCTANYDLDETEYLLEYELDTLGGTCLLRNSF